MTDKNFVVSQKTFAWENTNIFVLSLLPLPHLVKAGLTVMIKLRCIPPFETIFEIPCHPVYFYSA